MFKFDVDDEKYEIVKIVKKANIKVGDKIAPHYSYYESPEDLILYKKLYSKTKIETGLYRLDVLDHEIVPIPTSFTSDDFLSDYEDIKKVMSGINTFFSKTDVYKKYNFFPKRALLFHGGPGTGKSSIIGKVCEDLIKDKNTCVIIWPTAKLEAFTVESFLKECEYSEDIKKFVLIVEDIGGVEVDIQQHKMADSSMLSLLDNMERVFQVPTLIMATTNFPEHLLGNLTNRPQRFDEIIEISNPGPEKRLKLFQFFLKESLDNKSDLKDLILKSKYNKFSIAHIKESIIRSMVYDIHLEKVIEDIYKQIETFENNFAKKSKMGINDY